MGKLVDLTGKKFGKWTVLRRSENRKSQTYWDCRCDCGNTKSINGYALVNGKSKSCGCAKNMSISKTRKNRTEDLTGMRFGRLTVVSRAENIGNASSWNCICDCKRTKVVRGYSIKNGDTKSCGCLHKEIVSETSKIHGNCRLYRIWLGIKRRCEYSKDVGYNLYGGRGISVCKEWRDSYISFMDWALENGYKDNLTIDRIDVNGNYEPSNCRWATVAEQQNNRRDNVLITYNGETLTASEWSRKTGIKIETLTWRKRKGWSDKDCIETPVKTKTKCLKNSPN